VKACDTDQALREAMLAHRAGRMAAAEVGYRRVLRQRPDDHRALHFLGLLLFHQGDRESAIDHLSRSLRQDPSSARGWNALGGMLLAVGHVAEAQQAYRKSIEVAPSVAEGWYNLAICLRDQGEVDDAVTCLREAIVCEPDYSRAYEALAMLLYQLGRTSEAATLYCTWAARDPGNAKAQHMAAAASGLNVPERAADEYVRALFDESAGSFDANLEQLAYRSHHSVAKALVHCLAQPGAAVAVLDAGCGTGLCGLLLRPHCQRLVGVDLSPNMLDRARARNCYDELVAAELVGFMRGRPGEFDAVIAADTLVYFGALDAALVAARDTLRPGGWLVCSLEALVDGGNALHQLEFHGRYAHREAYVRTVLDLAGFVTESLTAETLRREREQDVAGFLVVARRR
jgi:predicted TPR repeat methyltransferase